MSMPIINSKAPIYSIFILFLLLLAKNSTAEDADLTEIVEHNIPAVVTISIYDANYPVGSGSGFIVDPSGIIVTNYHVIEGMPNIDIKTSAGETISMGKLLSSNKEEDWAIFKVNGVNLPTVKIGNSDNLKLGEKVIAIGNPLGLEGTVSEGIISGIRTLEDGKEFIQTTAPISDGSSGGPLFNLNGEVVGITTLTILIGQNLNFAVPINKVSIPIAYQILRHKKKFQDSSKEQKRAMIKELIKTKSPDFLTWSYKKQREYITAALLTTLYPNFEDEINNAVKEGLSVQEIETYIKVKEQIEKRDNKIPSQATLDGMGSLGLTGLKGYYIVNKNEGRVFVIEGKIVNPWNFTITSNGVKGSVFDNSGVKVYEKLVFPNTVFSKQQIIELPPKELENILRTPKDIRLEPGISLPFMVIFPNVPENLDEFEAEVSN